jgi:probable rRNA maturation factor
LIEKNFDFLIEKNFVSGGIQVLKLHIGVDSPADSPDEDPQSPLRDFLLSVAEGKFDRVFEEELISLRPETAGYEQAELSVAFMDSVEMREFNKKYRDIDEPTDVLSFPLWEDGEDFSPVNTVPGLLPLGDILICPEQAEKEYPALSREEALCLMLAHGFLHLLAWDHDTPEKDEAMRARQDVIVSKLRAALEASPNPGALFSDSDPEVL